MFDRNEIGEMTRRQFLVGAGAAAAGVAAIGLTGGHALAAGTRRNPGMMLGSGSLRFECIHDWLKPPAEMLWGDTQGVAQDSRGDIYISHTVHPQSESMDAIVVFNKHGKYIRSFGSEFAGGGHGLECRKEKGGEFLYHCDTAHRMVVKTDLYGRTIWRKGRPMEVEHYRKNSHAAFIPTNGAFSPNGDFYVTDGYGSDYILQYDVDGTFIRAFGGYGREAGQVAQAHGVWVDNRGSEPFLAVADRANHRIQYFTLDGKHVKFVQDDNRLIRLPCHFHTHRDLMLVPDLASVVTVLDADNRVVASLGDGGKNIDLRGHARSEYVPGQFIHPHGAKFLQNGDILVAEWVPDGRITLLRRI
jgi:hypothetical protein